MSRTACSVRAPLRTSAPGDLVVEERRGNDAAVEIREIEFLVRRVCVLIRQPDSKENGRQAENLLEGRDDRDGAPFAVEHRLLSESLFDGPPGGLDVLVVELGHPGL